jgi:spore coat polysaccharide biosynthesis protein SpsF
MKTCAIVQARMGSTRLPGKVLLDLAGKTVLERVIHRCQRAATLDKVIVATTTNPADNVIAELCVSHHWPCYRGSEGDVLDRYYQASLREQADIVVRITSDCPLIDPEIIDLTVNEFLKSNQIDYVSNTLPPCTFPRGLDVEIFSFKVLAQAWRDDHNPAWREHVTPYIYLHPEIFNLRSVTYQIDYSFMRWTLDTKEDFLLLSKIYDHFGHDDFSWHQVLTVLEQHPQWLGINRQVVQKEIS